MVVKCRTRLARARPEAPAYRSISRCHSVVSVSELAVWTSTEAAFFQKVERRTKCVLEMFCHFHLILGAWNGLSRIFFGCVCGPSTSVPVNGNFTVPAPQGGECFMRSTTHNIVLGSLHADLSFVGVYLYQKHCKKLKKSKKKLKKNLCHRSPF